MLKVIRYGQDEYEFPALIVLGCFDAIHLGHRELIKKAKLQAKINGLDLGVMMFKDGKGGKLVYSFEERLALLEQFNVKFVLEIDFNDEFKSLAPLDFLRGIEEKVNVKAYMSGKDFRFGAGAKGKSSTLKNYAEDEENGVWYMAIKDVDFNGEKVSTTLIKSCLDEGNAAKAGQLLGEEFTVTGEVVKGDGRGTSVVGFPTVNINYPEWKHQLKQGVYSVESVIDDVAYKGIANFGPCPTFGVERVALEAYFNDYNGDLYGRTLTIKFVDYLRDIETFESADALSEQLSEDLHGALEAETAEPVAEKPVLNTVNEEAAEAVTVTEPVVEEVITEEIVTEEQPVPEEETSTVTDEEPVTEEVTAEPVVEEPAVEVVTTEEVITEVEPTAEEVTVEETVIEEQPATEEIITEEAVVPEEQPATEEVSAEEKPTESENVD